MKSKEWVKKELSYDDCLTTTDRIMLSKILQDLERLEEIENLRTTPKALETCLANYMNKCIDLEKENQKLKKALVKACEMLEWGCPVEQDLIDYLDCENCKSTEKECWKKYFLNEVKDNEKD